MHQLPLGFGEDISFCCLQVRICIRNTKLIDEYFRNIQSNMYVLHIQERLLFKYMYMHIYRFAKSTYYCMHACMPYKGA
jgi:hypothetical protein